MEIKEIVKKVKQIEIKSKKGTENLLMGQYHSAFKGQGMAFAEVRPYQFGDDIRRIDWNKTAKFREPYVKVMEEERELTMMILVDISASMNFGTKNLLKRELVAEIFASLGFSAVGNNDKVGLVLFADKVYKVIPPQKGKKHILTLISILLTTEYVPQKTNLDLALNYILNVFKRKSLLFVFSDFADPFEEHLLKIAAKKHSLLGMRIFDEKEQEIPDVGYTFIEDIETGEKLWINTSSRRWRYNFAEEQKKKLQEVKQTFEKSNAHFINISSQDDYTQMLYQYFQKK